jgi:hypothetical protein
MQGTSPLTPVRDEAVLRMPGLETDNLLAQLASWGLLRTLEHARPEWKPRLSWEGPPWCARLHLAEQVDEIAVSEAANEGILAIAGRFDTDSRRDVKFNRDVYAAYLEKIHGDEVAETFASSLTAEHPVRNNGSLVPSPFVFMFGQGHQHFLERVVQVPLGVLPKRLQSKRTPPDLNDPVKIREALFVPWRREDETNAFRWDPVEDQRYALRFDDPSRAGAAATVHGANRLAAVGFSCLACAPRRDVPGVPGVRRRRYSIEFVWPIWEPPLALPGVLALLSHPAVIEGRLEDVRPLGVREIYRARRVSNGRYQSVTWAHPLATDAKGASPSSRHGRSIRDEPIESEADALAE